MRRRARTRLAARGASPAAFGGRCIPAGGVAPPSHPPGMLGRRALPAGRLARLGATPDVHHGLLDAHELRHALGRFDGWRAILRCGNVVNRRGPSRSHHRTPSILTLDDVFLHEVLRRNPSGRVLSPLSRTAHGRCRQIAVRCVTQFRNRTRARRKTRRGDLLPARRTHCLLQRHGARR